MDEATERRHYADRVAAYINGMEAAICGELHLDRWPNCDDQSHAEGMDLLATLDRPARSWTCRS